MTKTRSNRFSKKRRRGGRKTLKRRGGRRRSRVARRSRGGRRRSRVTKRGGKRRSRVTKRGGDTSSCCSRSAYNQCIQGCGTDYSAAGFSNAASCQNNCGPKCQWVYNLTTSQRDAAECQ